MALSSITPLAFDASTGTVPPVILCVDDEPGILSALRRLFRVHGFQVLAAESGAAGLELLRTHEVDLVISDMRMPEMDGVQFLSQVRQRKPELMRLLLTGYADIASIAGAINQGEIYRYIAKPWDDQEIILIVKDALERSALIREKKRLEGVVRAQNEELKLINASLEQKVEERTAELRATNQALNVANERTKQNFITSIKMFTSLIELRDQRLAGHSRRVADLARQLGVLQGLSAHDAQDLFVAGLLHRIGMIGFDDDMLRTPVAAMSSRQLDIFHAHPARAEELLMPLSELKHTVEIVASQLERFDGSGYPQGLMGRAIPMGARILAVASDFDSFQLGTLETQRMTRAQALDVLQQRSGRLYDPAVVQSLKSMVGDSNHEPALAGPRVTRTVRSSELVAGMVLGRDLSSPNGQLLLSAGHMLDDAVITKIHNFERSIDAQLAIVVVVTPAVGQS